MKLSIIVPVYNVEPYLRRCVDSILNQTFTDFELILVDDGSPDGCPSICDEYVEADNRIKVIHKKNGGLSDARNAGLDIAQGDFIGFVDSDDSISPEMYQRLMDFQVKTDADIVACGVLNLDQGGEVIGHWPDLAENQVYGKKDFISNFYPDVRRNIMPSVANKIFKRGIFHSIRFPIGKIYEDAQIRLKIYDLCETIAVCHEPLYYYYCDRPGSINNVQYSVKQFDMIDFSLRYYQFFLDKQEYKQSSYALEEYANNYMKNFFQVMLFHQELRSQFQPYRDEFRRHLYAILKSFHICKMKKIAVALMFVNKNLSYKLCLRLFPECLLDTME